MKLFKIKPLEWEELQIKGMSVHLRDDGRFHSLMFPVELSPVSCGSFDTFDEAKAAAEEFYRERMMAGLVEASYDDTMAAFSALGSG